jgi:hypothetical protein
LFVNFIGKIVRFRFLIRIKISTFYVILSKNSTRLQYKTYKKNRLEMFEWAYSGVDFSLYGNGGPDCMSYLSKVQLVLESACVIAFSLVFELYYPWTRSVSNYRPNLELRERFGRKLLLAGLCLIWGIEIGYKLSTRQLIFLFNPCHVVTFIQVR